jgi:hypothetical protein
MRPTVVAVERWTASTVIGPAAGNHPSAATALLRHVLAAAALSVLEEGGEGAALLLSLHRCVEGRKRVLILASLALLRHRREASGHVRLAEALLSRRHRSPRRFDVAAMGVGTGGSMLLASPAAAALLSVAMSSCAD